MVNIIMLVMMITVVLGRMAVVLTVLICLLVPVLDDDGDEDLT